MPTHEVDSRSYHVRVADQPRDNDTLPIGFYRFQCPLKVFSASSIAGPEADSMAPRSLLEPMRSYARAMSFSLGFASCGAMPKSQRLQGGPSECCTAVALMQRRSYNRGHRIWLEEDIESWKEWANTLTVQHTEYNHFFTIKVAEDVWKPLWQDIQDRIDSVSLQAMKAADACEQLPTLPTLASNAMKAAKVPS